MKCFVCGKPWRALDGMRTPVPVVTKEKVIVRKRRAVHFGRCLGMVMLARIHGGAVFDGRTKEVL